MLKVIEIAVKLYEKYSKVNIEKLYQRINEKIEKKREENEMRKREEEERGNGWNYSSMLEKTNTFFSKFKFGNKK